MVKNEKRERFASNTRGAHGIELLLPFYNVINANTEREDDWFKGTRSKFFKRATA